MKQYLIWANLNAEGKRLWGDIFSDGQVPIQRISTQSAKLQGLEKSERVFIVKWEALTSKQQQALLEKLHKLCSADTDRILKDIMEIGLPLRKKLTDSCCSNEIFPFLTIAASDVLERQSISSMLKV